MDSCRWLGVFVLASFVAWAAGQEDLTQPRKGTIQNKVTKLVSAELYQNAEGNLETRCVVLTFPDVPRQPNTNAEQPAVANTTLPEPHPQPSRTCLPPETPTKVYDSESLFGTLTEAVPDVSLIREEAKNYFVAYKSERSFSKAQVLGMILLAMTPQHERIDLLKSQIQSRGLEQEEPQIVVVCLPDGFKEERVVKECVENETGAVGSKTSYAPPFQKGDAQQDEKREIKTIIDLLKGSTSKTPDNKVTQTYLPSGQTSFSSFVTSSEQLLSPSRQPPPGTAIPTAVNLPPTQSPPSKPHPVTENGLQPPNSVQTAAMLQLSLSGIIRLPLSISKMTAELSLSFAPVAQTFPSTAKPITSKSPSFLKPPLRVSPRTTESSTSGTTPTTEDSTLPQTAADLTPVPSESSTAAVAPATTPSPLTSSVPLKNIYSSPPVPTPFSYSPTTSSATSPQLSIQPNTTPASSELSNPGKRWVTSE